MPRLILVRHGLTDYNAQHRYQGQIDIPLNETGLAQAHFLNKRLANTHFDAVYSSDLQRAIKTAQIVLEGHPYGQDPRPIPLLREISGGDFEGLTWSEITETFAEESAEWQADRANVAPPGGENLLEVVSRIDRGMAQVVEEVPSQDATILLVLHGGIISVMLCHLMGMDLDRLWQWRVDTCSVSIVDLYPKGAILSLFNDVAHIEEPFAQ
jgi:alpha-ribazole phosphatase